jgi:hypothetical protein
MNSDEEKPYTKSRFTTLQFKRSACSFGWWLMAGAGLF